MRGNKDDKRVLRSGNGRQNNSKRKIRRRSNNSYNSRSPAAARQARNRRKQKRKSSGTLMMVMIIALIAFVIGAGIGVSLSFDDGSSDDDKPQYENVTDEMTANLNDTEDVYFEKNVDDVDFNENQTSELTVTYTANE